MLFAVHEVSALHILVDDSVPTVGWELYDMNFSIGGHSSYQIGQEKRTYVIKQDKRYIDWRHDFYSLVLYTQPLWATPLHTEPCLVEYGSVGR